MKILFFKLKISTEIKVTQRIIEYLLLERPSNYGNQLSYVYPVHVAQVCA